MSRFSATSFDSPCARDAWATEAAPIGALAARLFGAADRMLEAAHSVLRPADDQLRREDLAALRLRLDPPAFDVAFREGQAAKFEDLEAMAR